ncbi:Crp/Fnr family transcriptional regulator [Streptomyces virginiae]|uniref:Crp/Fnr family transcriptional regulator n=1 Tax=Streptomyces virginiae TaxID=1961 RepID=UPI00225A5D23|nr:Crp/Fnr family transcriptional regulator [Streptomyces virginiae]MCX4962867.1 Crp/Fnr family transcriptional regulator [Streptomyces virginiae]MCX5179178.1 Crp/Fnr family transcriptional regulator [Streptomyces virginiae]
MTGKSDLWEALAGEHAAALRDLGVQVRYAPGDVILREHEPSTHAILLQEGTAKVVVSAETGHEVILGLREGPDIVGEMAALDGRPRSASVIAKTDVTTTIVTAAQLNEFLDAHPEVLRTLVRILTARLRQSDQARLEMASQTVLQRIASQLTTLAEQLDTSPESPDSASPALPLTQGELAAMVGASREAVTKALHLLRRQGVVTTSRSRIAITDLPVLRLLAAGNTP